MDKIIEKKISELFFSKTAQERIYFELTSKNKRNVFFKKIAHSSLDYIDKKCITKYNDILIDNKEILDFLISKTDNMCYCISYNKQFDGVILNTKEALENLWGNGMPFMLITTSLNRAYLETEYDFKSHKNYFLKSYNID